MELIDDRRKGGEILASKLTAMNLGSEVCVLALPRGGVPVAWEISQQLKCPMDLLFIKKIGAPRQRELAIGAVSEELEVHWQQESIDELKIPNSILQTLATEKKRELTALVRKWRKGKAALDIKEKTVIVVDDGLATGATMVAALEYLRKKNPKRVIVAVPVASESALNCIAHCCDQTVVLGTPSPFYSVSQWYQDFAQVTDQQMLDLLEAKSQKDREGQ